MASYGDPRYDMTFYYNNSNGEKVTKSINSINVAPLDEAEPTQPSGYGVGPTTIRNFATDIAASITGGTGLVDEPVLTSKRPVNSD